MKQSGNGQNKQNETANAVELADKEVKKMKKV
jgi:hypothetical protein